MPQADSFRARIARRDLLVGTFLNLGSPMAAELSARAGFDWLVLDMEHGALTESGLLQMLHAVTGTPAVPVVRVEEGTRLRIGRALDFGSPALMVPRVDTVAHAREVVRFVRYPPLGTRGVALPTRGARYGEVTHDAVATAHGDVALFIQVESREAVEQAEELAALDGVDVLFVGPTDLTHALGIPGDISAPAYRDAVARVGRAADTQAKAAGVLLWTLDELAGYRDAGFTVFAIGSDGGHVATGARGLARAFRERIAETPSRS